MDAETTWLSGNLGMNRDMTIVNNTFRGLCRSPVPHAQLQCNFSSCTGGLCDPVYQPARNTNVRNEGNVIE